MFKAVFLSRRRLAAEKRSGKVTDIRRLAMLYFGARANRTQPGTAPV